MTRKVWAASRTRQERVWHRAYDQSDRPTDDFVWWTDCGKGLHRPMWSAAARPPDIHIPVCARCEA